MREEENQADPEVQCIQRKNKQPIRKACLNHYYNNYAYCTFQHKLSKQNARRVNKTQKKLIILIMIIKLNIFMFAFNSLFCIKDLSMLLHI